MKKSEEALVSKGIRFPVSLFTEIDILAKKERRTFSGQVIYLCEKGMNELHQKELIILKEKIGGSLVFSGKMTKEDVERILRIQHDGDRRRFGEIAVGMKIIDQKTLDRYLGEDRPRRVRR